MESPPELLRLFSQGTIAVLTWTPGEGWPIAHASGSVRDLLGHTPETLVHGAPYASYVHPDDLARVQDECLEASGSDVEHFLHEDYRLRHANGNWIWVQNAVHIQREAGEIVRYIGYLIDVTERREGQRKIEEQRQRLELVVEGTRLGMWDWNPQTGDVVFNAMWAEMLGHDPSEIKNRLEEWESRVHPDDLASCYADITRHIEGEVDFYQNVHRMKHKSGRWVYILDRGRIVERDADGKPTRFTGTHTDITEQKQAEAYLRQVIDTATDAFFSTDREGQLVQWNRAAEEAFSLSRADALASTVDRLFKDELDVLDAFRAAAQGKERIELRAVTPDGREFPAELSVSEVHSDQGGRGTLYHVFARDITKRYELQAQVALTRRLEAVGRLASGIAHEINTPLQYVGDNVEFLGEAVQEMRDFLGLITRVRSAPEGSEERARFLNELDTVAAGIDVEFLTEEIPPAIEHARDGVGCVREIIASMKACAHPGSGSKSPTDLNEVIATAVTITRSEWKQVAQLETDLALDLPPVSCFKAELNQTLINLLMNAAQAIHEKAEEDLGRIRISTEHDAHQARIRIEDTGVGIPGDLRRRIFEPFFTTKPVGSGTGQGLSIVHNFTRQMGGNVSVESELGDGAVFTLHLPLDAA